MAIRLANTAAALPLLCSIGAAEFRAYHDAHSRLTARVVLAPMTVELVTSAWLVAERPDGVGQPALWAGLALALVTWVSTALIQRPQHRALAPAGVPSLVARNWPRTIAWTAHSGVVIGMLAASP